MCIRIIAAILLFLFNVFVLLINSWKYLKIIFFIFFLDKVFKFCILITVWNHSTLTSGIKASGVLDGKKQFCETPEFDLI